MYQFKVGDNVILKPSAVRDMCKLAADLFNPDDRYIGVVKGYGPVYVNMGMEDNNVAVEFSFNFPGGHDCNKLCQPHRGQYITVTNLELAHYDCTVPNVIPKTIFIEATVEQETI